MYYNKLKNEYIQINISTIEEYCDIHGVLFLDGIIPIVMQHLLKYNKICFHLR